MVPTFTCGLLRSNFSLAMVVYVPLKSTSFSSAFRLSAFAFRFGGHGACGVYTARSRLKRHGAVSAGLPAEARVASEGWSRCPESNWRPRPYQGRALPTELHRRSPVVRHWS